MTNALFPRILSVLDKHGIEYSGVRGVPSKALARCPFHSEKTPSFMVDTVSDRYRCMGCGVAGTSLTLDKLLSKNWIDDGEKYG
jgi:DNA primase